ncbi:metal-sulfur cluster assembly factor [Pseudonocardia nematodicida]|uniref:Metal-sulfur cluster assembly factor n=1 Tax=Pseudonocardia nematodicida TaxID=1206997 RepID=A0ABV1KI05_9PSEU
MSETTEHTATTENTATTDEADGVVRGAAGMPESPAAAAGDGATAEALEEAMKDVVDPELGINVVDLGLVYGIDRDGDTAVIDMTLTSAACPLTDVIEEQTRSALTAGPDGGLVNDIRINWVWMPPWGPEKITEDGREQLRALGFRV